MLPPLDAAQYLRLYPFLRAAGKVIVDRTNQGWDPLYANGVEFREQGGIQKQDIHGIRYGFMQLDPEGDRSERKRMLFPAIEVDMTVWERRMAAPGQTPFAGIDGTIQVADDTGSETMIEFKQDYP